MCKSTIKTGSGGALRGLSVDFYEGKLFTACYDDGYVYEYNIDLPISAVKNSLI